MNLRSFLVTLTIGALSFLSSHAENVPVDKAIQVAESFFQQLDRSSLKSDKPSLTLVYKATADLRSSETENYFYIFNIAENEGFIMVSGDDRALPILGYSTEKGFDSTQMSPSMIYWFERYQEQIDYAVQTNTPTNAEWEISKEGSHITELRASAPLIQAAWGQDEPYNNLCPLIDGKRSLTGCVATAMAMVMHYHKQPIAGTGSRNETDFNVEYDWENMRSTYRSFNNKILGTAEERRAVAELMYHCGQSVDAQYGSNATSGSITSAPASMPEYFGYDNSAEFKLRSLYTSYGWANLIKNEIDKKQPVLYGGQSNTSGHAFICDGYDNFDKFHINWGWEGYGNGYYSLDALQAEGESNYSNNERIVVNLKRKETNGREYSPLWLTNNFNNGTGITLDIPTEEVVSDNLFNLTINCLMNPRYKTFSGYIAVALTNGKGEIKEIISRRIQLPNGFKYNSYINPYTINCSIFGVIEKGDQIRLISLETGSTDWLLVNGGIDVIDRIELKETPAIPVESVVLSSTTKELFIGDELELRATVEPANATNKTILWKSDKPAVATVSTSGMVKAISVGTVNIVVTTADGNHADTCRITVLPTEIAGEITVTPTDPINNTDQGSFTLGLSLPNNQDFEGSLIIALPEGMYVNEKLSHLSAALASTISMLITETDDNRWQVSLTPQSLKADNYTYQEILTIKYDISDAVINGNYTIAVRDLSFNFVNGTFLKKNEILMPVVVERTETAITNIASQDVHISLVDDLLYVSSPAKERITLYTLSGVILQIHTKDVGSAIIQLPPVTDPVLILKGESGWTRKVAPQSPLSNK